MSRSTTLRTVWVIFRSEYLKELTPGDNDVRSESWPKQWSLTVMPHTHTNTNGKPTRSAAAWIRSYRISLKLSRVWPCSRIESQVCIHMHACKHERGTTRPACSFSRYPAPAARLRHPVQLAGHARTYNRATETRHSLPLCSYSDKSAMHLNFYI
jgi:hypothetical protein